LQLVANDFEELKHSPEQAQPPPPAKTPDSMKRELQKQFGIGKVFA